MLTYRPTNTLKVVDLVIPIMQVVWMRKGSLLVLTL